jgi:WS/DGAT/MGAT family acyltransferase
MHGSGIAVIEGEVGLDEFKQHLAGRLHRIPRYRQRLLFVPFNIAHPKWVDDPDFNLDNHVHEHQLDGGSSVEDAIDYAVALAEPLLPRDKPLWAMHLIRGVPDITVLLQVAHHAMVDGASGVDISLILFDVQERSSTAETTPEPWNPEPLPNPASLAAEALREATQSFANQRLALENFTGARGELLRRATESMTRFVAEPVVTAPWNRGSVGPTREFTWRKASFSAVRQIRNSLGGTINDVVLAVVVEAAARYMDSKGMNLAGQHLRVMCPVNVRREDEKGALGNRVSGIFPVFDAQPMAATERLKDVRWETEHIKQNREAQALQLLSEMMPYLPPIAMMGAQLVGTPWDPARMSASSPIASLSSLANLLPALPMVGFNFTCTNVPGVQTTQYLAGHKVLDNLAVLMLGGNLGFGMAILSYDQKLYFNFVCDPGLMPDLDKFVELFDTVLKEMADAASIGEVALEAPAK